MKEVDAKYDPGLQIDDRDCLCLHRNENLFVDQEWRVDVIRRLVQEVSISSYPDPRCETLRDAIAELYGVRPENIFVGNGSDEVLSDLFGLLRERYDSVGLLDACFKVYLLLARRFGYKLSTIPGDTFETGQISAEGWSGLAVVDSPNAITSTSLSLASLESLSSDENSFLIWDNVYGEFAGDMPLITIQKNVAFVRSFSKFYGLAALRVGYCVAHRTIVEELLDRKDVFNVNGFAQVMALEALRRRQEFRSLARQMIESRQHLVTRLRRLGFQVHQPSGNFVLATHPGYSTEFVENELLKRRIVVRRFPDELTSNHIRITVPPTAGIEQLMDALTEILETAKSMRAIHV